MMFPKDGKYVCPKCKNEKAIKDKESETYKTSASSKEETAVVTGE